MTIKVIGNPSWDWTYEYPDLGMNEDGTAKVSFTAYLKEKDKLEPGEPWLLCQPTARSSCLSTRPSSSSSRPIPKASFMPGRSPPSA